MRDAMTADLAASQPGRLARLRRELEDWERLHPPGGLRFEAGPPPDWEPPADWSAWAKR